MVKEFKKGNVDLIKVEWIDSNTYHGWHSVADALGWAENGILDCESIGHLVYEDSDRIVLAMNLYFGEDNVPEIVTSFGEVMIIPKTAIKTRTSIDWNKNDKSTQSDKEDGGE